MPAKAAEVSPAYLRCFIAVVDAGSFAEAGRRMELSTSAMSKMVSRLEEVWGVKVLHRSTHALSLTDNGGRLVDEARKVIATLDAFDAQARELRENAEDGWVRISAPVALTRECLAPLLTAFGQLHPAIRLDIRVSNERVDLAASGIDIALRGGALDNLPGHVARRWFTCPWVVCASPDYLAAHGIPSSPHDLQSGHRSIGYRSASTGKAAPWLFRNRSSQEAATVSLEHQAIFDDGDAAWQAARTGFGLVQAPYYLAANAIGRGEMVEVLADWRQAQTVVSILRRDTRLPTARVESVIRYLQAMAPRFAGPGAALDGSP